MTESLIFNKHVKDTTHEGYSEINRIYQGLSSHTNNVINTSSGRITNWAFILNTGGLTALLSSNPNNANYLSYIAFSLFSLGLFLIVSAVLFEIFRFIKRGKIIDTIHDKFENNEITRNEFLNETIYSNKKRSYSCVWFLEILSYIFFFSGLIIGLIELNY